MTSKTDSGGGAAVICLIVAVAENGIIGLYGKMPWHLPAELKYFRARTIGKPVIMGRKTFQSIGKPLPGRTNILITRDRSFAAPGIIIVHSLDDAIAAARSLPVTAGQTSPSEIMVLGGADIFRQALPLAGRVYLTRIAVSPAGDSTFPDLDLTLWRLVSSQPLAMAGNTGPTVTTCVYERIG